MSYTLQGTPMSCDRAGHCCRTRQQVGHCYDRQLLQVVVASGLVLGPQLIHTAFTVTLDNHQRYSAKCRANTLKSNQSQAL